MGGQILNNNMAKQLNRNGRANAFVLFGRAFKYAKKDFWVSIQVLLVITIVLAILFYFVEHNAQPEEYRNPWNAFVWALTRYIGDPGHFAGKGPITLTGRYIDTLIGILKILIYSVPAGLFSKGFTKAMEEDKRRCKLEDCRARIRQSFSRKLDKETGLRYVPQRISINSLQAKKAMPEADIIDTVSKYPEFRLRNLAEAQTAEEHPQDRIVVEMVPLDELTVDGEKIEKTDYGIKIDRKSNVTIIAPSSALENSIGHFSYYLAQLGGFNYISREFLLDADNPVSYYTIPDVADSEKKALDKFQEDIKMFSSGEDKWNLILISSDNLYDTQIHYVSAVQEKTGLSHTVFDLDKLHTLVDKLSSVMEKNHGFRSDLDETYRPVGKRNIGIKTGGGTVNNALTIRISYGITTWMDNTLPIIEDMAKEIKQCLEKSEKAQFAGLPTWKEKGVGFGNEEDMEN